jgi:hypothetical protein
MLTKEGGVRALAKKWVPLVLVTGLLATGGFLIWLLSLPEDPLKTAFDKIKAGMHENEACEIVGIPVSSGGFERSAPDWEPRVFKEWFGQNYTLRIRSFDGQVKEKQLIAWRDDLLTKIRRAIGR